MKLPLIISFLILATSLAAQNLTQTIKGTIADKDSDEPLWGAIVQVADITVMPATTDSLGRFRIANVPVGRHTLKITHIGYHEYILPELLISSGKEIVLSIGMQEKVKTMEEVVVTTQKNKDKPLNTMATVSARSFNVEETGRYAACINDPARMAISFAGVSQNGDQTNEIVVRGNSPRGLLWRIDGIEVPNPNHFSFGEGNSGGGVSILSNNMLSNSDFFSGAFPAEYGNALSGVFDINLRKGNNEHREYALQLGVLGMEAAAEGPISKKNGSSYLLSYRYSTLDLFYSMGIKVSGTIIPKYQDLSYKIYLPTSKAGKFTIWGIGGMSSTGNDPVSDSMKWDTYTKKLRYKEYHHTGVAGITHLYNFKNGKSFLKTIVALSDEGNFDVEDTLDNSYKLHPIERDTFEYRVVRASVMFNHKFDAKNVLRAGIIVGSYHYILGMKSIDSRGGELKQHIDITGNTMLAQGYVQWQYRPNEKTTINSGVHAMMFALNEKYAVEPRLGIRQQLNNKQALTLGVGLHSRIEAISNHLVEIKQPDGSITRPNKNVGFTRAAHGVIGYDWNITDDIRLKTEIYYQYLFDVPVEDTLSSFSALNYSGGITTKTLTNKGTGTNKGLELTLEKFFTKNYYFLFTASLYDSKYKGSDGIERNTFYNGRYILNGLAGKEFKSGKNKNNIFNLNTRIIYKGGNRLTPIDLISSRLQQRTVYLEDKAYSLRGYDYLRLDLQISYRKNKPKYSWIASIDFENLTNRKNVYNEYYDPKSKQIEKNYNLGILPILNFKVEF